jgi:ABC-2 type transport system ATP-binding protein
MIEVKNLCKLYGDRMAIDHLSFTVNRGEVVGFLGPNGAGKTTTMKIITGFMAPSSGSVTVGGADVFESPIEVKKKIGYLPETPPVYGEMRVEDYLAYVAKLRQTPTEKIKDNVEYALSKTNLRDVRGRMIKNLSKGFRQRVGLSQALVSRPEILILDEPTVGLDPRQVAEVRELILNLKGQHTIILSTHILPEVQAVCERIIIINQGKIVAEDSLEGLSHRMTGTQRVIIRVKRHLEKVASSLKSVPGVVGTSLSKDQILVDVSKDENIFDNVVSHVIKADAGLLEFRPSMGLEDIFIRLTSKSGTDAKEVRL